MITPVTVVPVKRLQPNSSVKVATAVSVSAMELVIHGTEDGLATEEDIARGRQSATARYVEHAIQGGNHAQYVNYGVQAGDGTATISAQAQQDETVRAIIEAISGGGSA